MFPHFAYTDDTPLELCPRTLLARVIKQLKEEFQLEIKVGCELEFQLLNKTIDADGSV